MVSLPMSHRFRWGDNAYQATHQAVSVIRSLSSSSLSSSNHQLLSCRWFTAGAESSANTLIDSDITTSSSASSPIFDTVVSTTKSNTTTPRSPSPRAAAAAAAAADNIHLSLQHPRTPMRPYPQSVGRRRSVPRHIDPPPYAASGIVPSPNLEYVFRHEKESIHALRLAAQLARKILDLVCQAALPGRTTDEIDAMAHAAIVQAGAYPSPLNYAGFPKSLCSSIHDVVCHGIPDARPLQYGDIVSFDVSCYLNGFHGDNCATVIVGDMPDGFDLHQISTTTTTTDATAPAVEKKLIADTQKDFESTTEDWRGVPYRTNLLPQDVQHFQTARRLSHATRESLYAAIQVCRPGACLSDIGAAIHDVADYYGYSSVEKYQGHGICQDFHCAPFVKHFRNKDRFPLEPGMIFTIEPMLVVGNQDTFEWNDKWTVATKDASLAAQFEHTILITDDASEILTLPP